jgi:hypothetical protein
VYVSSLFTFHGAPLIARREIFEESDTDHDNTLSLNEVATAFQKLQSKITSYPAVRLTLYTHTREELKIRLPKSPLNRANTLARCMVNSQTSMVS